MPYGIQDFGHHSGHFFFHHYDTEPLPSRILANCQLDPDLILIKKTFLKEV